MSYNPTEESAEIERLIKEENRVTKKKKKKRKRKKRARRKLDLEPRQLESGDPKSKIEENGSKEPKVPSYDTFSEIQDEEKQDENTKGEFQTIDLSSDEGKADEVIDLDKKIEEAKEQAKAFDGEQPETGGDVRKRKKRKKTEKKRRQKELRVDKRPTEADIMDNARDPERRWKIADGLFESMLTIADGVTGIFAELALMYTIGRYFSSPERLSKLDLKDGAQFGPLFVAESCKGAVQLSGFMFRVLQLIYKCSGPGHRKGCCNINPVFDWLSTEMSGEKLAKDLIMRFGKMLSIAFVLDATGCSTFAHKNGWLPTAWIKATKTEDNGNAYCFMSSATIGILASLIDIFWSALSLERKQQAVKIVTKHYKDEIHHTVEKKKPCEKIVTTMWTELKGQGFGNLGSALLILGLGSIVAAGFEKSKSESKAEKLENLGTYFMMFSLVGYGGSAYNSTASLFDKTAKSYKNAVPKGLCDEENMDRRGYSPIN